MRTPLMALSLLLLCLCEVPASAQYRDISRAGGAQPSLAILSPSTVIDTLTNEVGREEWASSYHEPEGKAPPEPDFDRNIEAMSEDEDMGAETEARETWNAWYRMYGPASAQDGRLDTAWVEGAEDNGIGEVLLVAVDATKPVSIATGFQKSKDLFAKNSRPQRVRLWVLQPRSVEPTQFDTVYSGLRVVAVGEDVLDDTFGKQPLQLPKVRVGTFVAIQILSVYPGTKYEDTCISEVSN